MEGANLAVEQRYAAGNVELVAELVRFKMDILAGGGNMKAHRRRSPRPRARSP